MSAIVPAFRPEFDTSRILSGEPVSAEEWGAMGSASNYLIGHGGMLVPWAAVATTIASGGTGTFHFYIAPKLAAVERVWRLNLRAVTAGARAVVTCGGASAVTFDLRSTRSSGGSVVTVREALSAKTNTAGDTSVTVQASGGNVVVESIGCYEQTRRVLAKNTTDYGVDITTLRNGQPIADLANESTCGVADAYKNLDARRAGIFAWSTDTASPLTFTSGSYTDVFPLHPPALGAFTTFGSNSTALRCAAYAKVNAGTGQVRFSADEEGTNTVLSITSTSFAWVVDDLDVNAEDLTVADGRRGSAWEGVRIEANDNTATTLSIAALAIVRVTTPI